MERGVAGQVLRGQIEDSEVAELRAGGIVGVDDRVCEEIGCSELEDDIGVGARGHAEIEADGSAELMQVLDRGGVGLGLQAAIAEEDKRDLPRRSASDEPEIGERGGGVGVERGVEDDAGLAGLTDANGALVAKMRDPAAAGIEKNEHEPCCQRTHHAR